jgi:DNA invertase Pin-like site-specific DNA recombinase
LTGISPKRRPSNALAKARALKMRSEGKTYAAIAQAVSYNRQSIYNWCTDAGVLVDCRRRAA